MVTKIIQNNRSCTGCTACCNACPVGAISMNLIDGFYKPVISESRCINCQKCVKVCPQNADISTSEYQTKAYACKNNDDDVRADSASGGFFTAIAEYVLGQNGVVYGVAFDSNFMACHVRIDSRENLSELRHSKYMQSNVGNAYKNIKFDLDNGKTVLFVGTPCQCAGLKSFLGREYDSLYILKVLCHGNPSPVVWKNYLQFIKRKKRAASIKRIVLSSKNSCDKASWSNSYTYIELDSSVYNKYGNHDPFKMLFARSNVVLNEPCYYCQYRNAGKIDCADISMSDFWGIEKINNSFNDGKGISLVLLHNGKAESLFRKLIEKITYTEVDPDIALANNGAMIMPKENALDQKVLKLLIELGGTHFGLIYYLYLPMLYFRKIISKMYEIVLGKQ